MKRNEPIIEIKKYSPLDDAKKTYKFNKEKNRKDMMLYITTCIGLIAIVFFLIRSSVI